MFMWADSLLLWRCPARHGLPLLRQGQVPVVPSRRLSLVGTQGVFHLPPGDMGDVSQGVHSVWWVESSVLRDVTCVQLWGLPLSKNPWLV